MTIWFKGCTLSWSTLRVELNAIFVFHSLLIARLVHTCNNQEKINIIIIEQCIVPQYYF